MNQKIFTAIKVISSLLMVGAIALELGDIYAGYTGTQLPNLPAPIFWIARLAITAHLIEGTIAAIYAPAKQKLPLQFGIYTFFVGTVGLLELFNVQIGPTDRVN